jgi:YidC/Oxa1 family membrane protein insertase
LDNSRNLLLAFVLSVVLIFGWDQVMGYFYPQPDTPAPQSTSTPPGGVPIPARDSGAAAVEGTSVVAGDLPSGSPAGGPVDLDAALANPSRVVIDTPRLAGSINLKGARIDDIVLKDYRETVEKGSGPVRLFSPRGTDAQYFAQFGFYVGGKAMADNALWQANAERLTPESPVTLTRTDAAGITYTIRLSIDEDYMITAQQGASNGSDGAAIIQPFALIDRTSRYASQDQFIVHSGPVAVFDGALFDGNNYAELAELGRDMPAGRPDWLGFTDQYWFSALIPGDAQENASAIDAAGFRSLGNEMFRTAISYQPQTVPAGGDLTQTTRLFAGAKESRLLDAYADEAGVTEFGLAISWGWFWFIEKPFLWLLRTLNGLVGNFGVAIILLTLIVRGVMFPVAQKQFASMAQMKAVQPKMKAIQERYKDDKQRQQQEIMKLYKDEKVNPLAGCLPLVLQIPIFFALYKVLMLAIEMRHEPFLYIRDLSAPDPATFLNLFGLLDFQVAGTLFGIGVLAVLLGITMWLTFKLNPSAMDPMQQQIFNLMPWFLMFVMAPFAAGLLIYWVTSNILTLAQQKYLYSKHPQLRAAAEQEKAAMAKKAAAEKEGRDKAEKGSA